MTVGAGLVLPLMGFWNSVIYLLVSHDAIHDLFVRHVKPRWSSSYRDSPDSAMSPIGRVHTLASADSSRELNGGIGKKASWSESFQGLSLNGRWSDEVV